MRNKPGAFSPSIKLINYDGRLAIMKDYSKGLSLVHRIIASWLVRHEAKLLSKLEGIQGIPRLLDIVNGLALIIEYIPGKHIGKFKPGQLPENTYGRFEDLVKKIHSKFIVHLDLRQKKNILISEDGSPYIIDLGSALDLSRFPLVHRVLSCIDRSGLLKFKQRYFPYLMTLQDKALLIRHHFLRPLWFLRPWRPRPKDRPSSDKTC